MVRVYTFPPETIPYPYILCNPYNYQKCINYILRHRQRVKSVIIDSGVEIFRDIRIKDYPYNHIDRLIYIYNTIRKIVGEVYVTCPDYPDDYHSKSLWINNKITNIERTLLNVEQCTANYSDVNWLIPIQGWNETPISILRSIKYLAEWGILDRYNYYGIANLCVSKSCNIIKTTIAIAYQYLKGKKIHAFGISIKCIPSIKDKLYSFDSTAWTRPVGSLYKRGYRWSCKSQRERELYFMEWLKTIKRYGVELDD